MNERLETVLAALKRHGIEQASIWTHNGVTCIAALYEESRYAVADTGNSYTLHYGSQPYEHTHWGTATTPDEVAIKIIKDA